ncbi:MAG: pyrimidine dimer DNA glycosylase/endonuclease V [Kiritimatiellae bacterium]|nr:pyrimidine dimer DNA glycosylase/endonuclease V [Kiritimatiellia bacterium]
MRLWSLHPKYLDRMGLTALWREGLLAQRVLEGLTRGYRAHPQLERFRAAADPLQAIGFYLETVAGEAARRGYSFDVSKLRRAGSAPTIAVSRGQIEYEWSHLLHKLSRRAPETYARWAGLKKPAAHPLFIVVPGAVAPWERT